MHDPFSKILPPPASRIDAPVANQFPVSARLQLQATGCTSQLCNSSNI